ncbi:MAG TPA: glycosyltransferase family A protein [Acidobacteriaceae bacterium]|nr:glycosyltransferase family A protein [Acidobacteriaceae bacterium]
MTDQQSPLVSVLFITYKRFDMLERSLRAFRENTNYPNLELVIADDGSGPEIQARISTLHANVFALSPKNLGLGANNNNGIRHCSGKYILMIQDDWLCQGPPDYLSNAIAVLEANPGVGLINFAGAPHPPDLTQRLAGCNEQPCYLTPAPYTGSHKREFLYSDQPHIHSRTALEYVGLYKEDRDMEECEIDYNFRWENQHRFSTAVFPAYHLRAFICAEDAVSFRTTRFRYKVAGALQPLKPVILKLSPTIFQRGRSFMQWMLRKMERAGLVR